MPWLIIAWPLDITKKTLDHDHQAGGRRLEFVILSGGDKGMHPTSNNHEEEFDSLRSDERSLLFNFNLLSSHRQRQRQNLPHLSACRFS